MFETPEGIGKFRINKKNVHLNATLTRPLEETLNEGLDFPASCFLLPQLGSDLPVGDPFATFAQDEPIIGTQAFGRILNDWVSGDFSLTIGACNLIFHSSSCNECLPGVADRFTVYLEHVSYWTGMLLPLLENAF